MELEEALNLLNRTVDGASIHFRRMPGSSIVLRYIKNSYQNDPFRSVVELCLFLFALHYLLAPRYSTKQKSVNLTNEEIEDMIDDFTPEPLVVPLNELEKFEQEKQPVIAGGTGPKVKLTTGKTVHNFASYNYLNLVANDLLKERAVQVLRNYGVGACGPPNFYGTQDVHMDTEREIARFLGVSECIVYAQSFSTISSVIPAFAKRGDIIVADSACNFSIKTGIEISRSHVYYYEHNNMDDLERVLLKIKKDYHKKQLTRRFIITEGLFESTGDMPDLPRIVELKLRYKYRLILDETHSFGVIGRSGRGLTEHQNVDPTNVEMLIGSLSHALCSAGGFCAGSREVVTHQRISSSAYVFSAALPAMLSVTASEGIKLIENNPDMLIALRENIRLFRAQLEKSEWISISSAPENPRVLISLSDDAVAKHNINAKDEDRVLANIVNEVLENGSTLISRIKHVSDGNMNPRTQKKEVWTPEPMIMASVSIGHSKKDVEHAGTQVRRAVAKCLKKWEGHKA